MTNNIYQYRYKYAIFLNINEIDRNDKVIYDYMSIE